MRKTTLESLRETVPPSRKVGYCDELNSIVLDFHQGAREEAGSPAAAWTGSRSRRGCLAARA
jgi:hypothetical protein